MKGFAVGRTIFNDAAEKWLAGKIDDRAAVEDMAARFARLTARLAAGPRREGGLTPARIRAPMVAHLDGKRRTGRCVDGGGWQSLRRSHSWGYR